MFLITGDRYKYTVSVCFGGILDLPLASWDPPRSACVSARLARGILDLPLASWDPPRSACVSARLALQQVQNTRFTSQTPSGIPLATQKQPSDADRRERYS